MAAMEASVTSFFHPGQRHSRNSSPAASKKSARSNSPASIIHLNHAQTARQLAMSQYHMPDCDPRAVQTYHEYKHVINPNNSQTNTPKATQALRSLSPTIIPFSGQSQSFNTVADDYTIDSRSAGGSMTSPTAARRGSAWVRGPSDTNKVDSNNQDGEDAVGTAWGPHSAYSHSPRSVSPAPLMYDDNTSRRGGPSASPGPRQGSSGSHVKLPGTGHGRMSMLEASVSGIYRPSKVSSASSAGSLPPSPPMQNSPRNSNQKVILPRANRSANLRRASTVGAERLEFSDAETTSVTDPQDLQQSGQHLSLEELANSPMPARLTSTSAGASRGGDSRKRGSFFGLYSGPRGVDNKVSTTSITKSSEIAKEHGAGSDRKASPGLRQGSSGSHAKLPGTGHGRMSMLEASVSGIYRPSKVSSASSANTPTATNATAAAGPMQERSMRSAPKKLLSDWITTTNSELAILCMSLDSLFKCIYSATTSGAVVDDATFFRTTRSACDSLNRATFFYSVRLPTELEDCIETIAADAASMAQLGHQLERLDALSNVMRALYDECTRKGNSVVSVCAALDKILLSANGVKANEHVLKPHNAFYKKAADRAPPVKARVSLAMAALFGTVDSPNSSPIVASKKVFHAPEPEVPALGPAAQQPTEETAKLSVVSEAVPFSAFDFNKTSDSKNNSHTGFDDFAPTASGDVFPVDNTNAGAFPEADFASFANTGFDAFATSPSTNFPQTAASTEFEAFGDNNVQTLNASGDLVGEFDGFSASVSTDAYSDFVEQPTTPAKDSDSSSTFSGGKESAKQRLQARLAANASKKSSP